MLSDPCLNVPKFNLVCLTFNGKSPVSYPRSQSLFDSAIRSNCRRIAERDCSCINKRKNRAIISRSKDVFTRNIVQRENIELWPDAKNPRYHIEFLCHYGLFNKSEFDM